MHANQYHARQPVLYTSWADPWAPHTPLQLTKRTGWVRCNVAGPESIADHMYRMAMMAMLCNSSSTSSGTSSNGATTSSSSSSGSAPIDSVHCMKMALVHDIAEAIVGDITPHCKVRGALGTSSWQPLLHATCIA